MGGASGRQIRKAAHRAAATRTRQPTGFVLEEFWEDLFPQQVHGALGQLQGHIAHTDSQVELIDPGLLMVPLNAIQASLGASYQDDFLPHRLKEIILGIQGIALVILD